MMLSKRAMRRTLVGAIGTPAMAGAILLGALRWRLLTPRPPRHLRPLLPRRRGARPPTWRRPRALSGRR